MNPYLSILLLFVFAALVTGGLMLLSHALNPVKHGTDKTPYESGLQSVGQPRSRFSVKFYLPAMLFILFDVEVVFLYPWAVLFKEFVRSGLGVFIFVEMLIFLAILVVGLLYIYGRQALEWD